jgi:hypothetical protein
MATASPPLLRRLALLLNSRIRANHLLAASYSASSHQTAAAATAETPTPAEPEAVSMTDSCVRVGSLPPHLRFSNSIFNCFEGYLSFHKFGDQFLGFCNEGLPFSG